MVVDTDRYGRTVGRVYADAMDVNAEMVRQGAAWVYRKYSNDPSLLLLEQEARSARRGLWALPETERLPPWEWRAAARESRTHVDILSPGDRSVGLHRGALQRLRDIGYAGEQPAQPDGGR